MRHLFYWLHAILALIGLGVCGVLLTATSGHPPGVVFLPLAVAAWLVAHAFLGLLQLLVVMGRSRLERIGGESASWPFRRGPVADTASLARGRKSTKTDPRRVPACV